MAFAPLSLANEQRAVYRSKTEAAILLLVEPGKSYRLQFTVSNLAEGTDESLNTGQVEIAVDEEAK